MMQECVLFWSWYFLPFCMISPFTDAPHYSNRPSKSKKLNQLSSRQVSPIDLAFSVCAFLRSLVESEFWLCPGGTGVKKIFLYCLETLLL